MTERERIRVGNCVAYTHLINIHNKHSHKSGNSSSHVQLVTVKYARLLSQQSGVALYLPNFTVDVSCVAAGETHTL